MRIRDTHGVPKQHDARLILLDRCELGVDRTRTIAKIRGETLAMRREAEIGEPSFDRRLLVALHPAVGERRQHHDFEQ